MSITEETHWLEADLEHSKQNLQEDFSQIASKLRQTRARLKQTNVIREKPSPCSACCSGFCSAIGTSRSKTSASR
jgi:hypothetical protein